MANRSFVMRIDGKQYLFDEQTVLEPFAHRSYEHIQLVPSTAWMISHGLNYKPSITISTEQGLVVEGDITHNSDTLAVATFSVPLAGTAHCI